MEIQNWVSFLVAVCFAVVCLPVNGTPAEDFALEVFLDRGLRNYSDWLLRNNLDPTPVLSHSVNLTSFKEGFKAIGEIKNQRVYNHSNALNWTLETDAEFPRFSVFLKMKKYWAIGEYHLDGLVDDKPFSGEGKSNLTALPIPDGFPSPLVFLHIANFTLTPDGYVDFATVQNQTYFWEDFEADFEALDAGTDAGVVNYEMAERYRDQIHDWLPLGQYLKTYLKELFAQKTWAEIIKA